MGKFRFRGRHRKERDTRSDRVPIRSIIPNLVTSLAACAGITSISLASEGRFLEALSALFVAAICDGLDGRIARLLKASSKLGAELDSLADFVNFGVAPAMFMYFWITGGPTHSGVTPGIVRVVLACSLYYAMCDCFRLARFNTMLEQETAPYWLNYFTGVPAPGGCWMVLTPALLQFGLEGLGYRFEVPRYVGIFMLLFVGTLMASKLPTISLKHLRVSRKAMPLVIALFLLIIAFLVAKFRLTLGILGAAYILTVPISGLCFLRTRARYLAEDGKKDIPSNQP